jgi:predicted MPP superfamily phosphohydrolase
MGRWRSGGIEHYSGAEICASSARWRSDDWLTVNDEQIWLDALPDSFSGLRVVQISDIHHGLYLPPEMLVQAVRQANRLNPDIVALTGDFVSYSRANIGPAAEILRNLRARHGVFAVLGNHDFRVDAGAITGALRRQRIEVLRNQHVKLGFGGASLYFAGVDDYGYGADIRQAMNGVPRDAATILLAHNPRIISLASRYGVSLILSGHTHGGPDQRAVAWNRARAFAGADAVQDWVGPHGNDANLRQPGHWNDCSTVAAALPGRNIASGATPDFFRCLQNSRELIPNACVPSI